MTSEKKPKKQEPKPSKMDEVLRRMLATPPAPKKAKPAKNSDKETS